MISIPSVKLGLKSLCALAIVSSTSAGDDKCVELYQLSRDSQIAFIQHHRTFHSVAWSPSGSLLVSGSAVFDFSVYAPPEFSLCRRVDAHTGSIYAVSISGNGEYLTTAGYDGVVKLWDVRTGEFLDESDSSSGRILAMSFLDDDTVVTGGLDGKIRLWSIPDLVIRTTHDFDRPVTSLAYSQNRLLVIGSAGQSPGHNVPIMTWDGDDLTEFRQLVGAEKAASTVSISKNGKIVATAGASQHGIRLWNTDTGETISTLPGHRVSTTALSFNGTASSLASTGQDGFVRVWDTEEGILTAEIQPFSNGVGRDVAYSPDGNFLCACGGYEPGEMVVWKCAANEHE